MSQSNSRIILNQILEDRRQKIAPSLTPSEFFEIFASEQTLKDYDLDYAEIESGVVGETLDGGIDGLYVIANGELVQEDSDLSALKRGVELELHLIQAKTSPGFSESAIDKLIAVSEALLDLSNDVTSFVGVYNNEVRAGIGRFRDAHKQLVARFPKVKFKYTYATQGDAPHANVQRKAATLKAKVQALFIGATCEVDFLGAPELLDLVRRSPATAHTLNVAEIMSTNGAVGFVCLVPLPAFNDFITHAGSLKRNIFESNVRDYQGRTEVNDAIQATLVGDLREDFWWLNNGVTVIASQATLGGKTLTIEDPQIVNGLQTSSEIAKYFAAKSPLDEERKVLVRVIVPTESPSRDRIIKATNSQTQIQPASLRATDPIHRNIEDYLKPRGLCYDRRKNSYKNEGVPIERIVSIPFMAQAVMAIVQRRPDNARSRPSSLLKKDDDYKGLFDPKTPMATFLFCAELLKRVEGYMRDTAKLEVKERGNIRFHVAMHVAASAAGKPKPSRDDLASMEVASISDSLLGDSVQAVRDLFTMLGGSDAVAKSADFLQKVSADLGSRLRRAKLARPSKVK